jgi:hypothetical protein
VVWSALLQEHAPAHVLRFGQHRLPMNSPVHGPAGGAGPHGHGNLVFEGPALPETDSEEDEGFGHAAGGVAAYRRHQEAMAVALSLGGLGARGGSGAAEAGGAEAGDGDSSRRFGERRLQRQRSIEGVVVSDLVSMGFSDERSAEAARAAMLTNPADEDVLEAALTFLAESPRDEDDYEEEGEDIRMAMATQLSLPPQHQQQPADASSSSSSAAAAAAASSAPQSQQQQQGAETAETLGSATNDALAPPGGSAAAAAAAAGDDAAGMEEELACVDFSPCLRAVLLLLLLLLSACEHASMRLDWIRTLNPLLCPASCLHLCLCMCGCMQDFGIDGLLERGW